MFKPIAALLLLFSLSGTSLLAELTPTRLRVRVLSQDAKVIGTGVGGAMVTIRNLETGEILSRGVHLGGTGDTDVIMRQPRVRGAKVFDREGTASYEAVLMLERPTLVEVSAEGPLAYPQAWQKSVKTMVLIPGEDVLGEGVILDLHGFILVLQEPAGDLWPAGRPTPLLVKMTMMCGCPIQPGGLWDADKMKVRARLVRGGQTVVEAPLTYAGSTNMFRGELTPPDAGEYDLEIVGSQPETVNFGTFTKTILVD